MSGSVELGMPWAMVSSPKQRRVTMWTDDGDEPGEPEEDERDDEVDFPTEDFRDEEGYWRGFPGE
jgi:hypothetical protein